METQSLRESDFIPVLHASSLNACLGLVGSQDPMKASTLTPTHPDNQALLAQRVPRASLEKQDTYRILAHLYGVRKVCLFGMVSEHQTMILTSFSFLIAMVPSVKALKG